MRRTGVVSVVALLVGLVSWLASPAFAQYPPGGAQNAGSHPVGSTFTVTLTPPTPWDAGSQVNLTVNGQGAGSKAAAGNGTVQVTIRVLSNTQLQVNPNVGGRCGQNQLVGSGRSRGATVTQTATFNVQCTAATGGGQRTGGQQLSRTGANVVRWTAGALVVATVGALLVLAARRRRVGPRH